MPRNLFIPSAIRVTRSTRSLPPLDREHEIYLAVLYHEGGDSEARNRLVESQMDHAEHLAWEYHLASGLPFKDLSAAAWEGLLRAAQAFRANASDSFEVYAHHHVLSALANEALASLFVHLGAQHDVTKASGMSPVLRALIRNWVKFQRIYGFEGPLEEGDPVVEAIANHYGTSQSTIITISEILFQPVPSLEDEQGARLRNLPEPASEDYDKGNVQDLLRESTARLLPRQREIIERLFFLQEPPKSIGQEWSITKGRVAQLKDEAIIALSRVLLRNDQISSLIKDDIRRELTRKEQLKQARHLKKLENS